MYEKHPKEREFI